MLNPAKITFFRQPYPATPEEAAERIASSYVDYAAGASAAGALPLFTGLEKAALKATLLTALSVPNPAPTAFVDALALGLTAFWMAPPVLFGPAPAGSVTVAVFDTIKPALLAGMLPGIPLEAVDALLRSAVHAATMTVLVTVTPPIPPAPVPLT